MDILFNNFGIFKTNEPTDAYSTYIDNIFEPNGNILSTYNFIRSNNIADDIDKIGMLKNITRKYIETKIKSIQSPSTCLIVMNEINNKMLRIRMLFEYLKNRKTQDLYLDFLNEYYNVCLENINIFVFNMFKQLIEPSTPQYIQNQLNEAFDIFIQGLNYHFETWGSKKISDDEKKEIIANTLLMHNKFASNIIFEFGNVIQLFFKSYKSLKFSDLIDDFKLSVYMSTYERKIVKCLQDANIDYTFKFDKLISNLPIVSILSNVNIFNCDPIFYDIIQSQLINSKKSDLDIYLEKLISGIESNIIITKNKYSSEHLFLDLAKSFKVLAKMLESWSVHSQPIKDNIINTINTILAQDDIIINYIVTSMVIFVKKININNFQTLKELVSFTSKCISVSNKESIFLDLLAQNLQSNLIKSKITEELLDYISVIIDHFDSTSHFYLDIKKFLYEIEINICYNNEISNVKIKSNKSVPVDMNLANTVLINKDIWKYNNKLPKIKLPDQIAIYFKAYEKFYTLKHSFRSIEWCYENSNIEIDINGSTISGSVIPISILVNIGLGCKHNSGIRIDDLMALFEIEEIPETIKKYLDLLISSEIVIETNGEFTIGTNLPPLINLNKLAVSKIKKIVKYVDDFDIANSTDCYIIKALKSISPNGLELDELTNKVNQSNKYFKVKDDYIKSRCDTLIKKSYLVDKDSIYTYDV